MWRGRTRAGRERKGSRERSLVLRDEGRDVSSRERRRKKGEGRVRRGNRGQNDMWREVLSREREGERGEGRVGR